MDKTFNTRSLSFSDYETLSLENRIYDELNIQESLVEDLLIPEIQLEIKNFLDNYQAIVYLEQGTIVLKVYNEYDFDTMDVYETSSYDNIQLEVYEKYLYVIIYVNQEYIVKKYSFDIEIQEIELNENTFTSSQFINCDIYQGNIIISELHQMEEETMLFIRKVTEESVELVSLINIDETDNLVITQLLEENTLIIVSNYNTYYQININDNSVVERYLVNPPISQKLIYSNELIYIGSRFENGIEKAFLFRNNESLYELDSVENLEIYQLELVGQKVLVIYSNNKLTKNILIYDLQDNSVVLENYKFEFLVMLEDLILLFDTRHHSNTFYVRYLSNEGKMLNLNVFQNGSYTYQELRYIRTSNNKIKLLGIRENEDDIETSYLIENIIYTNNSNGEYRTYETDVVLEETQEESENLSLEITNNLLPFIGGDINMRGAGDTNLELYSLVSVVSNNYLFNDTATYSATSKWQVKTGKYILKNIPPENPIAILTKNSPFITYKGLSYHNRNPNNLGQSLVKQITESGDNLTLPATATSGNSYTYYFYYGDVEIEVTGDFGTVSYYSYNNGYMGGYNNLTYDNTATVGASITNNLYMREGNDRIKRFSYHGGDSNYSPYVVGRDKDTTYTSSDDDSGSN